VPGSQAAGRQPGGGFAAGGSAVWGFKNGLPFYFMEPGFINAVGGSRRAALPASARGVAGIANSV
jgi:hypothetical protein